MNTKKKDELNLNRRDLLKFSGSGALALVGGKLMIGDTLANTTVRGSNHNVISIFLRGGHDALSMCAPFKGSAKNNLLAKRPNINYSMKGIGDAYFGLNSDINDSLLDLYRSGDLAIVHGVGGLNETTSHFAQMDYIESGHSKIITPQGFLGRFAEIANLSDMFALESKVPRSLRSQNYVMQISNKDSLGKIKRTRRQNISISKSDFLRSFFEKGSKNRVREIAQEHSSRSGEVFESIKRLNLLDDYKNKDIGLLTEMIVGDNPGIYTLSIGGWDHHRDLKGTYVSKVNNLFDDIAKLVGELKSNNKWGNTTIIIHSEFGRRIGENGSLGCDHGRGGIAYVLGGKVNGKKVYRKQGYVKDLNQKLSASEVNPRANLGVFYDVRNLYAEVFRRRFGLNDKALKQVFGNDPNFKFGKNDRILYLS